MAVTPSHVAKNSSYMSCTVPSKQTSTQTNANWINASKRSCKQTNTCSHVATGALKLPETYGSKPIVTRVLCEHQNRWETDVHSKALSSVGTVPLPRASSHCSVCRVLLATSSGAAISLGVHQEFDIPKTMWISASNPGMSENVGLIFPMK